MYKAINNLREQKGVVLSQPKGFTLIELLIVLAIIGILAAIAIPGYLGMQERGRKGAVIRAAAAAEADIQAWLSSSLKVGTGAALIEADTNWDGSVGTGDLTNSGLASLGVDVAYVSARNISGTETSPWSAGLSLWTSAAASGLSGQISVSQSLNQITITALDFNGSTIHTKVISAD